MWYDMNQRFVFYTPKTIILLMCLKPHLFLIDRITELGVSIRTLKRPIEVQSYFWPHTIEYMKTHLIYMPLVNEGQGMHDDCTTTTGSPRGKQLVCEHTNSVVPHTLCLPRRCVFSTRPGSLTPRQSQCIQCSIFEVIRMLL